jgi:hypothetical protein
MPKIVIDVTANDNATSVLAKVNKAMQDGEKSQESLATSMFKGFTAASLVEKGIGTLKDAFMQLTVGSLQTYAAFEQTEISLTTMLGSTEKATGLIKEMQEAARQTPYSFSEIANTGKQLIAFGVGASDVVGTLKRLGDVAAGLSQPIGDIAYLYGTVKTAGKAMSVDLMQFANRGIPIYEELGKVMGVNASKVKDLASQGKVGFAEIDLAFKNMSGEGGRFADMMGKQTDSLTGLLSNLGDNFEQIQVKIGKELAPTTKTWLTFLNNALGTLAGDAEEGGSSIGKAFEIAFDSSLPGAYFNMLTKGMEIWNGVAEESGKITESDQRRIDALRKYSAYLDGTLKITKEEAEVLKNMAGDYEATITIKKEYTEDEKAEIKDYESKRSFREREAALLAEYDKKNSESSKKTKKELTEEQKKEYARGAKDAEAYYKKLVQSRTEDLANEEEKIELSKQKKLEELKEKEKYFRDYQNYINAQTIIELETEEELRKLSLKKTSDLWKAAADLQVQFFEDSGNDSADAVGRMANEIADLLAGLSGTFSEVFKKISENSEKAGMSLGDYFQVGCAVATTALGSLAAVVQMQYSLVKAGYDAEIAALEEKMQAELDAYNESLENQEQYSEDTEALRAAELEAYAESLAGKTDKEIEYALAKKRLELKQADEKKEADKKKEAEQEAIKKKYALAEYAIELEAFKAQQEYQKSMVKIQTAIGVVNAWASSMTLGPIFGPIAAGMLTGLMVGTAVKQLSLIDKEKPPSPPAFAGGVTNFEGGLALVGEKGKEFINLPGGSNVITNENTEALLEAMGGARYIVNNIYIRGDLVQQDIIDTRRASTYGGY